jgi:hypothetical protein
MKNLIVYAAVLALFAGTAAMLPSLSLPARGDLNLTAAFRDGLYLGKLTAERGGPFRVASRRWSGAGDRALFAAGYQQGYGESLAHRRTTTLRHSE